MKETDTTLGRTPGIGPVRALEFMLCLMLSLAMVSVAAQEDEKCVVPEEPTIPDGSTAPEGELAQAQQDVKAYIAEGDVFLACLKRRDEALVGDESEEAMQKRALILHLHNQFVDQMHTVGDRFNEAVQAFRAR